MRNEDKISMQFSEEDLEKMPDSQKLTILVKALPPVYVCLFGDNNGRVGLNEKVRGHDNQFKLLWGLGAGALLSILALILAKFK